MSKKATPNKKIRELEKKVQRLEAEKEILNRAIDIADTTLPDKAQKRWINLKNTGLQQAVLLQAL